MAMRSIVIVAALSVVACGSPSASSPADAGSGGADGGVLDCAWAAGTNCWKTAIATAANCLPPSAEEGRFSTDGKTCTYASGTVVTFAGPLGQGSIPSFTVTSGSKMCLGFQMSAIGGIDVTLTTPGGALNGIVWATAYGMLGWFVDMIRGRRKRPPKV
jgi:hypothetical protein